jgi:hypothetical protein
MKTTFEHLGSRATVAGLPIFAEPPHAPPHASDWLSEVQLWEATDA